MIFILIFLTYFILYNRLQVNQHHFKNFTRVHRTGNDQAVYGFLTTLILILPPPPFPFFYLSIFLSLGHASLHVCVLGSSVHWIIQERIREWVVMPSLRGNLSIPGIKSMSLISPALANLFFTTRATWETPCLHLFPLPRIPFFDISIFQPLDTFTV